MMKLYRAANDDYVNADATSFAESLAAAEAYRDNPGFGGSRLWVAEVEPVDVLDLTDESDPVQSLADAIGAEHPGAIGADEWAPRVADRLADAGCQWVRVRESYPADAITWIYVGGCCGDEPDLEEID